MEYQFITTSTEDRVLIITLNRPDKLNALNRTLLQEIKQAIAEAGEDHDLSGIIITGSGAKAFAAGADISEFAGYSVEEGRALADAGHQVMNAIENSSIPVIAAVNGFALGGGCELALACHIRIASENAKFGQPEVNLGVIPGYGGTQRLTRLVGKSHALEMLITGDAITAAKAKEIGLVNDIVPPEELMNRCRSILDKVKTKSSLTIKQILKLSNDYYEGTGFPEEINEFGACFGTADFKEGTGAFLEKRKAEFTGK